ncbi:MAG TPA: DUF2269 family protein [Acidimicrobiia bacterium]|nr:DUF2269 family protein [Acidimicrobiia bacterium]
MPFVFGAVGDDGYNVVLVLHILCAIVGFGAVMLNGVYAAQVRSRRGSEGLAIAEANFRVSKVAMYFVYAVILLGFALVGMSDKAWKFDQTWIWLAIVLWVAAVGVAHGAIVPREKQVVALLREQVVAGDGPGAAAGSEIRIEQLMRQVAGFGLLYAVAVVAILALMVWKPGL